MSVSLKSKKLASHYLQGFAYRLRPITFSDAALIVDLRLADQERNQYIHPISGKISDQEAWLEAYLERDNDYYFVIENILTGESEGLVGVYDVEGDQAEWGRWVVKRGSLAALESFDLVCKFAFFEKGLQELYCRTVSANESVIAFHDKVARGRKDIVERVELNGSSYEMTRHFTTAEHYKNQIQLLLEEKAAAVYQRNLRSLLGPMQFHHIGIACEDIEQELRTYKTLGYQREGLAFEDPLQGIKGQFIVAAGQPRLELLENLPGSQTLDYWIEARIKAYHFAYEIKAFDKAIETFNRNRIKLISAPKPSTYFKSRICFMASSNQMLIELIEKQ